MMFTSLNKNAMFWLLSSYLIALNSGIPISGLRMNTYIDIINK